MNIRQLLFLKAAGGGGSTEEEKTATGNPVVFSTGLTKNLTGLTIPISDENGVSSVKITRSGKNMFDKSQGIKTTSTTLRFARNSGEGPAFPVKAGITYCISIDSSTPANEMNVLVPLSSTKIKTEYNTDHIIYTPESDSEIAASAYWTGGRPEDATDFQIEIAEEKTTFEAYNGKTETVSFGESVEAGTLDAITGKLTVTAPAAKTIQLTPVEIATLNGVNTVWTNTDGSNTVKYLQSK